MIPKFRAWDKDGKFMIAPKEIGRIHFNPLPFGLTLIKSDHDGISMKFELMMSTGLKDKNGKEYFKSDIGHYASKEYFEVIWDSSKGRWCALFVGEENKTYNYHLLYKLAEDSEIIGNIFENEDLLKGE